MNQFQMIHYHLAGLHKRLALRALMLSGDAITSIMLGFMCVTAFLSMWISNAATTAMMMPILEVKIICFNTLLIYFPFK